MLQKIIHNFTAVSRKGFGIHSPFVFDFQRKIIRGKDNGKGTYTQEKDKVLRMLLRMVHYYKLEKILLLDSRYPKNFDTYSIEYDTSIRENNTYNLVVVKASDFFDATYLDEKAFVVLTGNHKEILKNPHRKQCNVFLNLYTVGICVYNKGLSRQEFKLKF